MKNRILYISLKNIKAVKNGTVFFPDYDISEKGDLADSKSSVLGIYGQNGSGKTTLYNCFDLLKTLSLGRPIYSFTDDGFRLKNKYSYLVNMFSESGTIEYGFLINYNNTPFKVIYRLTLNSIKENDTVNIRIKEEKLYAYKYFETGERWKRPFAPLVVNYEQEGFLYLYDGVDHESGYSQSLKNTSDNITLFATKKKCTDLGLSFIFSQENINFLMNDSKMDVKTFGNIIDKLRHQLAFDMFLFAHNNEALSLVGLGSLLGTSITTNNELHGAFGVSLNPFYIQESNLSDYRQFLKQINIFISSFVPGFEAKESILESRNVDGRKQVKISINRKLDENNSLPLSEESSGIRKLFFISCALIYIYGNQNGWLIVDEIDSGVYEDLLGEILLALENTGKGQIMFTAHNLVPLERVSPSSIVFTTYNVDNRFIQIKGLSHTNNLRDVYLRALKLGGQKEKLSSKVDTFDIEIALGRAYKAFLALKG